MEFASNPTHCEKILMATEKEYQWERFWCLSDRSYSLADGGFLVDPDSSWGKSLNPFSVKFEQLSDIPCLILLGEPGMGKTSALKKAYSEFQQTGEKKVFWFDLRSYSSDDRLVREINSSLEIEEWIAGKYQLTIFFDSLDECLLNVRTVSTVLIEVLKKWPIDRLGIRFGCRSLDWPKLLDEELSALFGSENVGKYELLPLRKIDISVASSMEGVNSDIFIQAVQNADVTSFANRPITLRFLLNSYKEGGRLPESKAKIYWHGCRQLCEEQNRSRIASRNLGKLSSTQKLIVASRIAAILMFSKRDAISLKVDAGSSLASDVMIESLSGFAEEIDGNRFVIDEDAVRESLGTGLFSLRGNERLGFAHHTYAEYLASYYLDKHEVEENDISKIIFHPDSSVVPQLEEVAVWLASFNPRIFDRLLRIQPELLLRVDQEATTTSQKSRVVDKILTNYQALKFSIDVFVSVKHLRHFCHNRLSNQLKKFIANREYGAEARLLAILFALECKVIELSDMILLIALNQNEDLLLRKYAALTIASISDQETKAKLMPLASGQAGSDPEDELKGVGLSALWPDNIEIQILLKHITPLKNRNLIGTYYMFLAEELVEGLRSEDLPLVLHWILDDMSNLGSEVLAEELISKTMLRAWKYLEIPSVIEPFTKLAYRRILGHQDRKGFGGEKTYVDELLADDEKRHLLAQRIMRIVSLRNVFLIVFNSPILIRSDIDWIVSEIDRCNEKDLRLVWANALFYLIDRTNQEDLAKAYFVYDNHIELRGIFSSLFEPVQLDSELAKEQRGYQLQLEEIERGQQQKVDQRIDHLSKLYTYLDDFEKGNANSWWKLNLVFLASESNFYLNDYDADLTQFPLWQAIDAETKDRVISFARTYLIVRNAEKLYQDDNKISRPAFSAFRALYLLAVFAPERLGNLPLEVWTKWCDVILTFPTHSEKYDLKVHKLLIQKLYEVDSGNFVDAVTRVIFQNNQLNLETLDLIDKISDVELQASLTIILDNENLPLPSYEALLRFLLDRNVMKAKEIALRDLDNAQITNEVSLNKGLIAAKCLIYFSQDGGWPTIGKAMNDRAEFGERLFLSLSYRDNLVNILLLKLREEWVGDLFIWLETRFPAKEDPEFDEVHEVLDRENLGHLRDLLVSGLANKGTYEACEAIRKVMHEFPDKKWILHYLHACEENLRRASWEPMLPHAILEIVLNSAQLRQSRRRKLLRNSRIVVEVILAIIIVLLPSLIDSESNPLYEYLVDNQVLLLLILIAAIIFERFLGNSTE